MLPDNYYNLNTEQFSTLLGGVEAAAMSDPLAYAPLLRYLNQRTAYKIGANYSNRRLILRGPNADFLELTRAIVAYKLDSLAYNAPAFERGTPCI